MFQSTERGSSPACSAGSRRTRSRCPCGCCGGRPCRCPATRRRLTSDEPLEPLQEGAFQQRLLRHPILPCVASRTSWMTRSAVMPSASASKFRMTRWRSAGSATSRTSSNATLKRPSRMRADLGAEHQRLQAARARAVADVAPHRLRGVRLVRVACGSSGAPRTRAPAWRSARRARDPSSRSPSGRRRRARPRGCCPPVVRSAIVSSSSSLG